MDLLVGSDDVGLAFTASLSCLRQDDSVLGFDVGAVGSVLRVDALVGEDFGLLGVVERVGHGQGQKGSKYDLQIRGIHF